MNKIVLVGRNVRDIELTQAGKAVCARFVMAVNRPFKNQDGEYDADFINCVAWENKAELLADYVKKGDKLLVTGRLQIRNYENKDGIMVYTHEVVVEEIEFLESKPVEEVEEPKPRAKASRPYTR